MSLHITRDGLLITCCKRGETPPSCLNHSTYGMLGIGRFGARVFCKFCPYHRHHEKLLNCGLSPIALPWGWDRNRSLAKKSWRCLSASRLQLIKKHILFQELSFLFDGFCIFFGGSNTKIRKGQDWGIRNGPAITWHIDCYHQSELPWSFLLFLWSAGMKGCPFHMWYAAHVAEICGASKAWIEYGSMHYAWPKLVIKELHKNTWKIMKVFRWILRHASMAACWICTSGLALEKAADLDFWDVNCWAAWCPEPLWKPVVIDIEGSSSQILNIGAN